MKTIQTAKTVAAALAGTTILATAAAADVTAQQVWDNWTDQMAVYGQGFTTSGEDMSGDTLTVSGVQIAMSDDEAKITATIGDITLTENGDGTVTVMMPPSYPITIDVTPEFGDPSTVNVSVRQTGMSLVVSGDPDAMVYDLSAEVYSLSVDSLEGEAAEEVALEDAMIAMRDLSGQYSVVEGELTDVSYDMNLGALDLDVLFREKGGTGVVSFNGDIADLAMMAKIVMPQDMDMEAEQPPFADGLAFSGGYSFGDLRYIFDFNADGEAAAGTVTAQGGELSAAMDIDGLSYAGTTNGIDVSLSVPNEVPFPLEATLGSYGYDFVIPLSQGDDGPRDARAAMNITDLEMSNLLWNLVDPGEALPREPVTVALGIDAEVTPYFSFLDPEQQQAAMMSEVPGELNSATITELTVRGAGAEITGEGAFTFDNTDLVTFDGLPRPEGTASFALNGINGLIDTLVSMGLIPEEEAMMPRMMMGMFTTPVGEDQLTSTIEINSEGQILANGQRLR